MSVAVRVENLSKRYRLGELDRATFWDALRRRFRGIAPEDEEGPEIFWALRDVSFDIQEGQVVAIIGRNGAGKSTLLKILSSITAPTRGSIKMRGRVASLLEVGTGFHPDLTGRENVYLNGAILGMREREVAKKFDEILDFSGVEQFIDTPLKRYSSGMRVRLAFAVAAHLEPEILVIDEVLAVGDAAFQRKCLGKIGEVAGSGRTVLFVSHNAAAIASLCNRGVVLDHGRVVFQGTQMEALTHYNGMQSGGAVQGVEGERSGSGEIHITAVEARSPSGEVLPSICAGQDVEIWLHFRRNTAGRWPALCARLHFGTEHGLPAFAHFNDLTHTPIVDADGSLPERGAFVCQIPRLPLVPGLYLVECAITSSRHNGTLIDKLTPGCKLMVDRGDYFGTGELPDGRYGPMLVSGRWRREQAPV